MRYLLLLFSLLAHQYAVAKLQGKARIDSCLSALATAKEDTMKASLLGHLSFEYRTINPDTGIYYADQALELSQKLQWKHGLAIANSYMGLNYKYKAEYPKALEHMFKGLRYNEEIGAKMGIGSDLGYIGMVYQDQGNYDKALEFYIKSLKINEELKDTLNLAGDYGNIGIIYNIYKADYPKALEYEMRSLMFFEYLKDKDGIAHNLGNIGEIYQKQGNYEKALEYDFQALAIFEQLGDKSSIAINLGNIGSTYLLQAKNAAGDHNKAEKLKLAKQFLNRAIGVCSTINDLEGLIEYNSSMADAHQLSGNYTAALQSYKTSALIRDSVYSMDNQLKISKLETARLLDVKDKQIMLDKMEVSKKRSERLLLGLVTLLLLAIIAIGVNKYIAQTRSNKQLQSERTKNLKTITAQASTLSHIAHTQSHEVSGQVATILGLVSVFNSEDAADPENKIVIEGIYDVSMKLDAIVKAMIVEESQANSTKNTNTTKQQ